MRRDRNAANFLGDGEKEQMIPETGAESYESKRSTVQMGSGWDDDENQLVTPRMIGLYRQLLAGQLTDKQFQTEIHYLKQRYFVSAGDASNSLI